jgi:hypothetical protein
MKYILMVIVLLTSGCNFRAAYPAIGGGLGGGVGSLAGPGGAIAGGIAGAGIGTAMMETGAHAAIEAKVDALTSGDVAQLIKQQAAKEKSGFDTIVDNIYRVLWLLGIGAALWLFIPILYTRFIHKKLKNGGFKK